MLQSEVQGDCAYGSHLCSSTHTSDSQLFLHHFEPDSRHMARSYDTVQARELSQVGCLVRCRCHPLGSERFGGRRIPPT